MNLETVAISRQIVETQGLTLISEALKDNKIGRGLPSMIALIWPQVNRLTPVKVMLSTGFDRLHGINDPKGPVQILIREGFVAVHYDNPSYSSVEYELMIKLLYSTYPSGTQYLAGIGIAEIQAGDMYLHGIPYKGLNVGFSVRYFSEKASMNIPYKELDALHSQGSEKEFLSNLEREIAEYPDKRELILETFRRWKARE